MKRLLSDEQEQFIIKHIDDMSYEEMAKHFGITKKQLIGYISKRKHLPSKNKKSSITSEQEQFILDNYLTMDYSEIAKRINCKRYNVVYFLKKNKLEGTKKNTEYSNEETEYILSNYLTMDYADIAKNLGWTRGKLSWFIRQHNLNGTKGRVLEEIIYTPEQEKYVLSNFKEMTYSQIAEDQGITKGTVKKILKKNGLKAAKRKMVLAWDDSKIDYLKKNYLTKTDDELAKHFLKTPSSVFAKRISLGLFKEEDTFTSDKVSNSYLYPSSDKVKKKWANEEEVFVKENYNEMSDKEMAHVLNRSAKSVKHKRLILGLHRTHTISSGEIELANILDELNIDYEQQFHLDPYHYDFKVGNTLIEYNGDYWHCNPDIYENGPINYNQLYTVKKDANKYEIAKENGYEVLVVWENDLINNKNKVLDMMAVLRGDSLDDERAKSVEA